VGYWFKKKEEIEGIMGENIPELKKPIIPLC
jgi:hypothetical protein